jgi:hypothetical protein
MLHIDTATGVLAIPPGLVERDKQRTRSMHEEDHEKGKKKSLKASKNMKKNKKKKGTQETKIPKEDQSEEKQFQAFTSHTELQSEVITWYSNPTT